ncbi:MAG TPA: histone, partial [Hyphomicrobiaceae bacterium]|nr:histone [Hyphomicrobiaceae bacterium]
KRAAPKAGIVSKAKDAAKNIGDRTKATVKDAYGRAKDAIAPAPTTPAPAPATPAPAAPAPKQ